jgi:hypothetical protein
MMKRGSNGAPLIVHKQKTIDSPLGQGGKIMKVKFDNLTFKMSEGVTGTIDNMTLDGEVDELVKFIDLLLEAEVLNPELEYDREIEPAAYDISEDFEIGEPKSSPEKPESSHEDIWQSILKLMPEGYFAETGFRIYKWNNENARSEIKDDGKRISVSVYTDESHLTMYIRPSGINMYGVSDETFWSFMDYVKEYIPNEINYFIRDVYRIYSK